MTKSGARSRFRYFDLRCWTQLKTTTRRACWVGGEWTLSPTKDTLPPHCLATTPQAGFSVKEFSFTHVWLTSPTATLWIQRSKSRLFRCQWPKYRSVSWSRRSLLFSQSHCTFELITLALSPHSLILTHTSSHPTAYVALDLCALVESFYWSERWHALPLASSLCSMPFHQLCSIKRSRGRIFTRK